MTTVRNFVKDPGAVLDWPFNWSKWLHSDETISDADITISPSTGTSPLKLEDEVEIINPFVVAWLSQGDVDETYTVSCTISTSQSRVDTRSISIRVIAR